MYRNLSIFNVLLLIHLIFNCSFSTDLIVDIPNTSILDIVLEFNPNIILNVDTPESALVGEIDVVSDDPNAEFKVSISPDDPYFILDSDRLELRLKKSGAILFKDVNFILLSVTATQVKNSQISLTKYIRIPIEHNKEDTIIKVDSIEELCDSDSDKRILTINIEDPGALIANDESYKCYISSTNHPNFNLLISKISTLDFEVYLPKSQKNLFDYKTKPNFVFELSCVNNNLIVHKRTIDFKLCHKIDPIKDVILVPNNENYPWIKFKAPAGSVVGRFKALDPNYARKNYEYLLAKESPYFKIVDDQLVLKKKFEKSLLKYVKPKINVFLKVKDKDLEERTIVKKFTVRVDETGEALPPVRFRSVEDQQSPIYIKYAQDSEVLIKLGTIDLDPNTFPPDDFDVRLNTGANVSLDDQGNLFMPVHPLKQLNDSNQDALITVNIFDKKQNINILEENFEIPVPPIIDVATTPGPSVSVRPTSPNTNPNTNTNTNPTIASTTPSKTNKNNECIVDRDCNTRDNGPNLCVKLSSLKDKNILSTTDTENLVRRLLFLSNRDPSIFPKYNQIFQALASPTKELGDILQEMGLSMKDMSEIGVCLCEIDFTGFRCRDPVVKEKPSQCFPNSNVPSCGENGVCQISEFVLRNNLQAPVDRVNQYKSFFCECRNSSLTGINCDVPRDACNTTMSPRYSHMLDDVYRLRHKRQADPPAIVDALRRYPANFQPFKALPKCDPDKQEICVPLNNGSFLCTKPENKTSPVNFLIFEESNNNPKFADEPNRPDKFKRLNVTDAPVITGIQDFLRDEVIPRYAFNDYAKIPKGPIAIMRPSIDMPNTLNGVRSKINDVIGQNNPKLPDVLNRLQTNRVQQLILDTVMYLIGNNKLPNSAPLLKNISQTIDRVVERLNLSDLKNIASPIWDLLPEKFPPNMTDGDPTGLVRGLEALNRNSELINKPEMLKEALTLNAPSDKYLDQFNKPYSILRLDILPGIYVEPNGDISVRPTPGVFLSSAPTDNSLTTDRDLIFLPGIFNPVANSNCDVKSIFMPGIMSLPIENYNLANLQDDPTKYLNKFTPMQLPFNLNGFLTPLKSSTADTIEKILRSEINNEPLQNLTGDKMLTHLLLTPIDFNADSNFDIITKNEKFMTNLFSNEAFLKVIREQRQFNTQDLAATQVLSNPTMLPLKRANSFNTQCLPNPNKPKYNAKNVNFFVPTTPAENINVLPFVVNDDQGNAIPQEVVRDAIAKFCTNYQVIMNEFHARLCQAQSEADMIRNTREKYSEICPNCSYVDYANAYYNLRNSLVTPKKKPSRLPLLILAALLTLLTLLWLLSMLCLCCPCCLFARRKPKPVNKFDPNAIRKSSSKIFGSLKLPDHPKYMNHISYASGELVRSISNPNIPIYPTENLSKRKPNYISTLNSRDKVFSQVSPALVVLGEPSTRYLDSKIRYFPDQQTIDLPPKANTIVSVKEPMGYKEISETIVLPSGDHHHHQLPTPTSNKIASLHSSSLVNEPIKPEPFYADIKEPTETFIAKRLPNRRWSLTDPNNRMLVPFNIQTKHSGSSVNEEQTTHIRSGENITTHIIENSQNTPIAIYKYDPKIDSNLMKGFRSTDNLFQLKRLSHHINSNDSNYKRLDSNDNNDPYYSRIITDFDPIVFKLHRIENNNPNERIMSDQVTSINRPKYREVLIPNVQKQVSMKARRANPLSDDLFEVVNKSDDIVVDWLLRKCDSNNIEMKDQHNNRTDEEEYEKATFKNDDKAVRSIAMTNPDAKPESSKKSTKAKLLSKLPLFKSSKIKTSYKKPTDLTKHQSLEDDEPYKQIPNVQRKVRCCYCDKEFNENDSSNRLSRRESFSEVMDDDLLVICDSCYNSWNASSDANKTDKRFELSRFDSGKSQSKSMNVKRRSKSQDEEASASEPDAWKLSDSFKRAYFNPNASSNSKNYRSSIKKNVNPSEMSDEDTSSDFYAKVASRPNDTFTTTGSSSSYRSSMHGVIKDNNFIVPEHYQKSKSNNSQTVDSNEKSNSNLKSIPWNTANKSINWSKKYI